MMRFAETCLIALALLLGSPLVEASPYRALKRQNSDTSSPTVDLGYATYRGARLESLGVNQYLGMRYAKPPVGDLRFRAPQDPAAEADIQDATRLSPLCLGEGQNASSISLLKNTFSEDCLFVNVFTPSKATPDSKLPVWVHFQGGGYSIIGDFFNGSEVIRKSGGNVVFVNFNYRVGPLGFLASEKVRANGDLNAGLLDQRKVMQWVQDHIAKFGGDPAHVVIHGTSAGAGAVAHHLAAFDGENQNLFVAAILQNFFWPTQRSVDQMEFQFEHLTDSTGCTGDADELACLRDLDVSKIQEFSIPFQPFPSETGATLGFSVFYWLPVTEGPGTLVPDLLSKSFGSGKFVKVPVLTGDVTNEGSVFVSNASTPANVSTFMRDNFPRLNDDQLGQINDAYPQMEPVPNHAAFFPSLSAAYGDATFICPGNLMTEAVSRVLRDQAWNYRYNVQDPDTVAAGKGVPHVLESAAIFGPGFTDNFAASYLTTNAAIVPVVMAYFTSFVRALDPNTFRDAQAPLWEVWGGVENGQGRRLKLQTNDTVMEEVPQVQVDRCALWRDLRGTTQQ